MPSVSPSSVAGSASPPPRRRWLPLVAGFMGGMGLAVVGFFVGKLIPGSAVLRGFSRAEELAMLALAGPAVALGVLVHELGHVVGGKLAGFRFLLLLVGPLKLQRTPAGLRFGLSRSMNLAGGLACLLPDDDRDLSRRMAWFIAGGPLASLLLGVVGVVAGWAWYGSIAGEAPPGYGELLGAIGLLITGVISIGLFLVSAVPASTGGFATDGRRLVQLLQRGPAAERTAALTILTGAALSGVRSRDYPVELVTRVSEHDDSSTSGLIGKLLGYYHWLDRGEPARAGALLGDVLAGVGQMPKMTQESVWAERAYWLAVYGGEVGAARAALVCAGRVEFDPAARLRAEAAVLRAEGNQSAATAKATEALDALQRRSLGFKPPADLVEWIEALREPRAGDLRPPTATAV